jgi:hypothetical protein
LGLSFPICTVDPGFSNSDRAHCFPEWALGDAVFIAVLCLVPTGCRPPSPVLDPHWQQPWVAVSVKVSRSLVMNTQGSDSQCSLSSTGGRAKSEEGRLEVPHFSVPPPPFSAGRPTAGISHPSRDPARGQPRVQESTRLPLQLLPYPKSLSCSACGPISIATPCDATKESGSFRKVGGKGAEGPFIVLEHGSWGLGQALWDGLPSQLRWNRAQGCQPGGLEACQGLPVLAWAWLACRSLWGTSLGSP